MSTEETNTAVNSAQISMLIESNREIKEILAENSKQQLETNKSLNVLIQAQIRTEERQSADRDWQKKVEAHQDKQDLNIEKAKDMAQEAKDIANEAKAQSLRNGMWINFGVAVLTGIAIYIVKMIIDLVKVGVTP